MPDVLNRALSRIQARWRARAISAAIACGGAAFAAVVIVTASALVAVSIAVIVGVSVLSIGRRMSPIDAAIAIESRDSSLHNLIVTAAELATRPRPVRAEFLEAINAQAAERIAGVDVRAVVPLSQSIAVAAIVVAGCIALISRPAPSAARSQEFAAVGKGSGLFTVRVTPPGYTHRKAEVFDTPSEVSAIVGSEIQVRSNTGEVLKTWIAAQSEGIEVSPDAFSAKRFLAVTVVPDTAPVVRIVTPGKDSAFARAEGRVAISIDGRDDLGLASLVLKLTKASGGGENVAFTESEVPIRIERRSEQDWQGGAELSLESLGLADGDIVVYRAVARDTNPSGAPVQSEQYVIEIGKNAVIADAGFALPPEERKYAISQQMVIYKSEQLLAKKLPAAGQLDEARGIAIEQRMVRAEVVFLGGGEVEDEVEEAAQSSEVTEGRLQNTGRVEMLKAINAMSRAEAQLNEGRLTEAIVFERQALASLERALDRRRFFLRTLPDRSRIDASRRLTGERRDARSWTRDAAASVGEPLDAHRVLIRELAALPATGVATASIASRLTALDPSSAELRQTAVALANANSGAARQQAVDDAMRAVSAHALQKLPASVAIESRILPLSGLLADELAKKPGSLSSGRKP